jgi:tRNA(Ile)-lysidine synthase
MSVAALAAREVTTVQPATSVPLTPAEIDRAFAGLLNYDLVLLAVSGGADSTALMHQAAAWATRHNLTSRVTVVTIDHGLRPASKAETLAVTQGARSLGLTALIKSNHSPPPAGPFAQSWARDLRYRLLLEAAGDALRTHRDANARAALVTAHHQDDQAETVLMRLARGSGIDGLAGMRPVSPTASPSVDLVRPFLTFSKERLRATLTTAAISWSEDPSNTDPRFERVRLRNATTESAALGLTTPHLALSAHRAARAADALEAQTRTAAHDPAVVTFHDLGYARLSWPNLQQYPAEIRLRLLAHILSWLSPERTALGQLEALTEGRDWQSPAGQTLQHCALVADGDHVLVLPELGRLPRHAATSPTRFAAFDITPAQPSTGSTIAALNEIGLKALKTLKHSTPAIPRAALLIQPALFDATGDLLSAPTLGYHRDRLIAAPRLPPTNNSPA